MIFTEKKYSDLEIRQIKENYSLSDIYQKETGNNLIASGDKLAGLCCFHDDTHSGNFYIYQKSNSYHCFACNAGGDIIKFIQELKHLSFNGAIEYLTGEIHQEYKTSAKKDLKPIPKAMPELSDKTKEIYRSFFEMLELSELGRSCLAGRGFNSSIIEQSRIRSIDSPNIIFNRLKDMFTAEELTASGLADISKATGNLYFAFYLPCLIFTVFENGQAVSFSSRNFTDNKDNRFFKLHKVKQKHFIGNIQSGDKNIFLLESFLDCLSLQQMTGNESYIALNGLGITANSYNEIASAYAGKNIVIALDNDQAGNDARLKLNTAVNKELSYFNYNLLLADMGVNSGKDFNEILIKHELKQANKAVINANIPRFRDQDYYNDYLQNSSLINAHAKDTGRNSDAVAGDYVDYLFGYAGTDQMAILKAIGEAG